MEVAVEGAWAEVRREMMGGSGLGLGWCSVVEEGIWGGGGGGGRRFGAFKMGLGCGN